MEKITTRNMKTFVLSSFINFGIGWAFGFIVGLLSLIAGDNGSAGAALLVTPFAWGILFSILATNMYRIYFYYRLSLDVNAVCKGDGAETESYLIASMLSVLTLGLYRVYWTYKLAQRLRANAPRYGFKMLETGKEIAVLNALSFGYIAAWELIKNMNKVAKVYNQTGLADVVGGVQ